jgi:hypothetical protein
LAQILQEHLRHHRITDKNFGIAQPERLVKAVWKSTPFGKTDLSFACLPMSALQLQLARTVSPLVLLSCCLMGSLVMGSSHMASAVQISSLEVPFWRVSS